jgi:hypothetical protein
MILGVCGPAGAGKDLGAERFIKEHGFVRVAFADPLKRYAKDIYDFTDEQLWGPSEMRNLPDKRYPRDHTWKELGSDPETNPDFKDFACACCGQTTMKRQVEDDVFIPDLEGIMQCYLTARYALQLLGTEYGRHCYPDTWVELALRTAKRLKAGDCYYDMKTGLRYTSSVTPAMTPKADVVISDVRFLNEIRGIHRGGGYVIRIVPPPRPKKEGEVWRKHQSELEQESIPDAEFDAVIKNEKNGVDPFWAEIDKAYQVIQSR